MSCFASITQTALPFVLYASVSKEVIGKTFLFKEYAKALQVETPILIPVNEPGPRQAQKTSISFKRVFELSKTFSISVSIEVEWLNLVSSIYEVVTLLPLNKVTVKCFALVSIANHLI